MSDDTWNEADEEFLSLPGPDLTTQLRARLAQADTDPGAGAGTDPGAAGCEAMLEDLRQLKRLPMIEPDVGFEERLQRKLAALPAGQRSRPAIWAPWLSRRWPLALSAASALVAVGFLLLARPESTAKPPLPGLPVTGTPYGLDVPLQPIPALPDLSAERLDYPPEQIHDSPVPL